MSTLKDKVEEVEKQSIIDALKECNWVMARAARMLGITDRMIGYKIRKYGIKRDVVFRTETGHEPENKSYQEILTQ
jgi:transcriptional regulator with GAF, ATPase, and Fis domain